MKIASFLQEFKLSDANIVSMMCNTNNSAKICKKKNIIIDMCIKQGHMKLGKGL